MLNPLLAHYQSDILANMIADHQYVLDSQVETSNDSAETFCMKTLRTTGDIDDEIMVYGIHADSRYFPVKLNDGDVFVSDSYADKYELTDGDKLKLKKNYADETYDFTMRIILPDISQMIN